MPRSMTQSEVVEQILAALGFVEAVTEEHTFVIVLNRLAGAVFLKDAWGDRVTLRYSVDDELWYVTVAEEQSQ